MNSGPEIKTILIVEDNPVNQKLFLVVLRQHGYRLLTAGDGEEALVIAGREIPDLILMDLQLPKLNGFMVAQRLKESPVTAQIPVVALSAHPLPSEKDHHQMKDFEGFITKPIDTRAFPDQIREIFDRGQQ